MKQNESNEECEHIVKIYIKNSSNVGIDESEYNRIHRIGPKIKKNSNSFQQIIVKFKGFVPRTKVYRAKKHNGPNLTWLFVKSRYLLNKRRYLLKDAYGKAKGCANVNFACADINCFLCLRLKNGDWKFFNSLE